LHIGDSDLDAIDAIVASLYTDGKINSGDDDDFFSHPEMVLEL
jgi:hypothetical protein